MIKRYSSLVLWYLFWDADGTQLEKGDGITNFFSFLIDYKKNFVHFKKFFCHTCDYCKKAQWFKCTEINIRGLAFPILLKRKKLIPLNKT